MTQIQMMSTVFALKKL